MIAAATISSPWKMYCHFWSRLRNVVAFRTWTESPAPPAGERPEDRPPPADQPRPAEHHGGDRRQRAARPLPGVADAELREQDDRAEEGEERGAEVPEQRGAVDGHAEPAGRLLLRA